MSITFGADTFGLTKPSGYLQESSEDKTIEIATIRDELGKTMIAQAKPRSQTITTVKTKSDAVLLTVPTSGDFNAATVTSSKMSQTNDDFSMSEATYTLHE
jgi:hypothetical protein